MMSPLSASQDPTVRIERHWPRWPTVDEVLAQAERMLLARADAAASPAGHAASAPLR